MMVMVIKDELLIAYWWCVIDWLMMYKAKKQLVVLLGMWRLQLQIEIARLKGFWRGLGDGGRKWRWSLSNWGWLQRRERAPGAWNWNMLKSKRTSQTKTTAFKKKIYCLLRVNRRYNFKFRWYLSESAQSPLHCGVSTELNMDVTEIWFMVGVKLYYVDRM